MSYVRHTPGPDRNLRQDPARSERQIKDLIICGGFNVYPRMIEDALYEHPAVAEAIVIGIPDSYRGQAPLAFVTLRAGEFRTGDELRDFLRTRVSAIELPVRVEIRTSLPKTMVGKLSRKELIAEAVALDQR